MIISSLISSHLYNLDPRASLPCNEGVSLYFYLFPFSYKQIICLVFCLLSRTDYNRYNVEIFINKLFLLLLQKHMENIKSLIKVFMASFLPKLNTFLYNCTSYIILRLSLNPIEIYYYFLVVLLGCIGGMLCYFLIVSPRFYSYRPSFTLFIRYSYIIDGD